MANLFVHEGQSVDYTPAAAVNAGVVVVQNGLAGVTQRDIAANALGALRIEGVFDFDKQSSLAIAAGSPVYWDAANSVATTTVPGNTLIGRAVVAAGASDTSVRVYLQPTNDHSSLLLSAVAASTAISNTATQTAFDQAVTIPANTLRVGDVIRVVAQAIATATNSTDTLNVTLRIGTQDVIATGAVDVANSDVAVITADLVIRTIGASGTFVAAGLTAIGAAGTATARPQIRASTAIDTTAALSVNATATWSVANAGNSVRLDVMDVQLIRR
jgi:hypothetical protein